MTRLRTLAAALALAVAVPAAAPAQGEPDVTGDGVVDILDVSLVASCLGADPVTSPPPCQGVDPTGDGVIDLADLELLSAFLTDATDRDLDAVPDLVDSCPDVANSDQRDTDGDGLGDACDACTLADDPLQEGWDPLGTPPPDFAPCSVAIENGLSVSGLQARYDHLFVAELGNFPLRPAVEMIVTPRSAGAIAFPKIFACSADSIAPLLYDLPTPGNGFAGLATTELEIWKGYSSLASRAGTRCIMGVEGTPGSNATFDLDLDAVHTQARADTRNLTCDPVTGDCTFDAASADFSTEGTNHRWISSGTAGLGQCTPQPLTLALQNPGEINEGPSEANYDRDDVPVQTDVFDCCTWTFDTVDGDPAIPAVVLYPIGNPTAPLDDSDGDFFPDRCDVCPEVPDAQFDDDGDRVGNACDNCPAVFNPTQNPAACAPKVPLLSPTALMLLAAAIGGAGLVARRRGLGRAT